jgi:peroxiredoxin
MQVLWLSCCLVSFVAAADPVHIDDFELRDCLGGTHRLSDWRDRKLVVVVFLGVECPLARLYAPRLAALQREFDGRVSFVGIDANRHDSVEKIAQYIRDYQVPFPVLKDVSNRVADRFGAGRNPEAFVLDEQRTIRYHGRIDDQYQIGVKKAQPDRRDLALALEELLAGRPVSRPQTEASGCVIGRARSESAGGQVTYCRDVAPIIQDHCLVCHRKGQVAPFALTSYRAVSGWSETIREALEQDRMPPWSADPRHGKFANDPRLAEEEKRVVFDWLRQGCPEGEPSDLPPPRPFPEEWTIPTPDRVVSMPQPFTVPAEGIIEYQYVEVDPHFREDKWIKAAEIRPGNRAVVHHCTVFLRPPGAGKDDVAEQGALGSFCLAATAPGTPPESYPDGMAKKVPAGWKFLFVLHYQAVGKPQTDQTSLGLVFADPHTVRKEVATRVMIDDTLSIPPHAADHRVEQTWEINDPVLLLSLFPHMHLRGRSFRYEAFYPDGSTEVLLDVPRWDFNWQHRYVLAGPKRLPAGSRLRCSAVYDNSAANPNNPDPGATVRAGPQSTDEMFNGYFDVVLADEDRTRGPTMGEVLAGAAQFVARPGVVLVLVLVGGFYLLRQRLRARQKGGQAGKPDSASVSGGEA